MIVASDVMRIGRNRMRQEFTTASNNDMPSSSRRCVNSTMRMLFDTTMPTIISTPISDCTFSVVLVTKSATKHAGEPGRHGEQNQDRVGERAKLRDQNQIEQHQREHQSEREAPERGLHALDHAAHVHFDADRQASVLDHRPDAVGQCAEVFPRWIDVDVDDSSDLVVVDLRG